MKYLFLIFLLTAAIGCSENSTNSTVQHQVISPKSLTYATGEDMKTLSITHTCTCPFNWYVYVLTSTGVLKDTSGYGDNSKVPLIIDRSKMTSDTLQALLQIKSGFGTDTVQVTVIK